MKDGHLLIAHPAGEVSAMQWGQWVPVEAPWSTIPARLAISARAAIVPAWCEGTNSRLFHAAGLIHPRLRTALPPGEFVARCGSEIEIRIGRVVASDACANDAEALTRLRVQISAAHEAVHIAKLVDGLTILRREFA
jgi:putative hemolysin